MIKLKSLLETDIGAYKIYCDLDGVLSDFEKQFYLISNGITAENYKKLYGAKSFWNLINDSGTNFWSTMPLMTDAMKLWNYIKPFNPTILTAAPLKEQDAADGKPLWVKNHLGDVPVIVTSARKKKEHAAPNHILIDDTVRNIEEWISAGGIGILHKDADSTIKQLESYLPVNESFGATMNTNDLKKHKNKLKKLNAFLKTQGNEMVPYPDLAKTGYGVPWKQLIKK